MQVPRLLMSASFPERRASCLGCFRQRIGSWSMTSEYAPCELGPAFSLSECPQVAPARASFFSSQMAKTQIPRPTKVGNPMICKGTNPKQNPYILHLEEHVQPRRLLPALCCIVAVSGCAVAASVGPESKQAQFPTVPDPRLCLIESLVSKVNRQACL